MLKVLALVILAVSASACGCLEEVTVISIGGCDAFGTCGVMTDKGPARVNMPVVGQKTTEFVECKK